MVENVPEFQFWGPIDPKTGRPIKERQSEYFNQWIKTIESLGFRVDWRILNAADYGDATTRQRFFLIARSDDLPLDWPTPTHAKDPTSEKIVSLYGRSLKKWRPARDIIDWSIRGKSIFNRKKPLSPRTLERLLAGAAKLNWHAMYVVAIRCELRRALLWHAERARGKLLNGATGNDLKRAEKMIAYAERRLPEVEAALADAVVPAPEGAEAEAMMVVLRRHADGHSLERPTPAITGGGQHVALAQGLVFQVNQGEGRARNMRSADNEPLQTIVTRQSLGLAAPTPIVMPYNGEKDGMPRASRGVDEPLGTQTTENRFALVEPFVLSQHSGGAPRSVSAPIPGMTGDGAHAIVTAETAMILPVTHEDGSNRARGADEPLPTITTAKRGELAFIVAAFGEREGQTPRVHTLDQPTPTICAEGRIQLVEPGVDFDVLFRMFEWQELARAMSFSDADTEYEFCGTKTEIVKQIGNAVPAATAAALAGALIAPLPRKRRGKTTRGHGHRAASKTDRRQLRLLAA